MTVSTPLFSWAFLSVLTLVCIASAQAGKPDDLASQSLSNLLAAAVSGQGQGNRTSTPVKEFFDEYYAGKVQEMDQVSMWNLLPLNFTKKDLNADKVKVLQPSQSVLSRRGSAFHQFNCTGIDSGNTEIIAVELRQKVALGDSERGILFVYQLLQPAKVNRTSTRKLLASLHLRGSQGVSKVVLDATSAAKDWLHSSVFNHGIEVEFQSESGITLPGVLATSPLLVFYMNSHQTEYSTVEETRLKRNAVADLQAASAVSNDSSGTYPCGVQQVILTREELGLADAIYAPTRIELSYCSGYCHWPFADTVNATNSGKMQGRAAALTNKVPEPCCAPKEYGEVSYIFYVEDSIETKHVQQATVLSCECK